MDIEGIKFLLLRILLDTINLVFVEKKQEEVGGSVVVEIIDVIVIVKGKEELEVFSGDGINGGFVIKKVVISFVIVGGFFGVIVSVSFLLCYYQNYQL